MHSNQSLDCRGQRTRYGFLLLFLLPFCAAEPHAESLFSNPTYDLDRASAFIQSADLDGDGRLDLIAAEGGLLQVRMGLPDGQLGAPTNLDSPDGNSSSCAVGDFNGDGIPDLAHPSSGSGGFGGANVFLGLGAGRFSQALVVVTGGYQDDLVAAGDFNGDGWSDLVVGSSFSASIWVALSRGDGTFDPPSAVITPIYPRTTLVVADLNGDGKQDLVVPDTLVAPPAFPSLPGFVRVFPGLGDGTFGPPISTGVGIFPFSLAVADLNRDGKPDLAVANHNSASVSILLGQGDASFTAQSPIPTQTLTNSVVALDLDQDGMLDLAIGADDILSAHGRGDGSFDAPIKSHSWGIGRSLAAGDFDGDSRSDIAVLNSATTVALLFSNGDGTVGAPLRQVLIGGSGSPGSLNAADFNRDGIPDLVGFNDTLAGTEILVRLAVGNGDFDPVPRVTPLPSGLSLLPNSVGDFNGDGDPDLVLESATGPTIYLGNGDGTLTSAGISVMTGGFATLAIADFDGDRRVDLALGTFPDTLTVLKGMGDGTFVPASALALGFTPLGFGMVSGDFNGDHAMDVAIVPDLPLLPPRPFPPPPIRDIYVLFGHGDGTFAAPMPVPAATQPLWPVAGDFNGDGISDLAVPDTNTFFGIPFGQGIPVLLGHADGTFTTVQSYFPNPAAVFIAAADFDGDGKLDLAVEKRGDSREMSILIGRGDGSFRPPLGFGGTLAVGRMVTGDFDSDGRTDLVVEPTISNSATILFNRLPGAEHAPVAATGGDQMAECGDSSGAGFLLDGSASSDSDSTPGTHDDIVGFEWLEVFDFGTSYLGRGEKLAVSLTMGTHRIRLVLTDRAGETDAAELTLAFQDTTPPDVAVTVSPSRLWSPNHKMVPIHASVVATDSCGAVTVVLESVTSSEPDNAPGDSDGNTAGDIQDADPETADFDFLLRAERAFPGPGRTYLITYRATDAAGNVSRATSSVLVPATFSSGSARVLRGVPGNYDGLSPARLKAASLRTV